MHRAPPRSIFSSILRHLLHCNNHVRRPSRSLDQRALMEMAMADDYYAGDLEDVVHRLLPRELLADIGIVAAGGGAPPSSCAARRSGDDHAADVVEDLVGIPGIGAAKEKPRPHLQHSREQRRGGGMGNGSRAPVAVGGGKYHGGATRHAPAASCWHGTAPRVPRFDMAVAHGYPPARSHGAGAGTGVFLPRVEAYVQQNRATSTSPSPNPRSGAKPPRVQRREAAVVVAMRRQQQLQLLQLRAMAAEMQRRQREAFAAAFHGCHAVAPPQQWTY